MTNNTQLRTLIELYRIAGKPAISGVYLPLQFDYSPHTETLLRELITSPRAAQYIVADELTVDGTHLQSLTLPIDWKSVSITLKLPRDSIQRFHNSIDDLIKFPSVRNGEFPTDFYIIDIDYHPGDTTIPPAVQQIKNICRLIKALSKLAHYHDKKATDGEPRLVFIQGSDGKSKSAILQPTITNEMLGYADIDCNIVEQLQDDYAINDVNHHIEKRGIFRNTLVEYVNENNFNFQQLIEHWTDFRLAYDNNLSVYLSGFNFHKARKDVAAAELEFSEKTSKTISDLTAKILAIPLSLLAAIGIWKLNDLTEQFVALTGIIFTSLIITLIISSQWKQLRRIIHAKEMIFNPFSQKLKSYPKELQGDIESAIAELKKNERFSFGILVSFYVLCWIPTIVGIAVILYKEIS
ncbi:hypothetical protein WIC43_16840 [Klebsiella pneumoniae]|uniref:hypothetical protein n=1 Tax=Klebsiella/Raoultella group TaxID=2890311 RepID=UPI0003BF1028|nr:MULTISPECIES: hypothetical protein [Klebsiella/Raoultella group]APB05410.1 hypothetical protein BK817_10615 [Raoultella ornithinolytica]EIV2060032.1 hypothetical protein [Klebsiella pneumoniae]EIW1262924.1 hypothetical protein [Klebsiella pneumoniae]EKT4342585.1 hypothetical protein [Klebsiella pneumoniae]EKU2397576.1 hypothetical protein [Klebsiella pneumoniae]